jgi:hypothetical protein
MKANEKNNTPASSIFHIIALLLIFKVLLDITPKVARRQVDSVCGCFHGSFVQIYVFILNVGSPAY